MEGEGLEERDGLRAETLEGHFGRRLFGCGRDPKERQ
jgi:hypothetical protein